MPDPQVLQKSEALARMTRHTAGTPFARNGDTNLWYFADIPTREQNLLAVQEIYEGNFSDHVDPFPGETFGEAQQRPGQFRLQSLKAWIERRNTSYDQEPTRRFYRQGKPLAEDDPVAEALADLYRVCEVNEHLKQLERELELYGNVVLLASFDPDFREPLLDRYISPRVRVVENARNPRRPYATVLTGSDIERDQQMRGRVYGIADAYITPVPGAQPGLYRAFGPNRETSDWESLATPRVPIVHCFDALPTTATGYYVDPLGLVLAKLNVCINEDFLSRFGYTVLMQSHGQMVIFGHDDANPITIGPGRAIKFSGLPEIRQDVSFATPNADLANMREAIQFLMRELREVYSIPPSEIDIGQDASGRSRIEARAATAGTRKAKQAKLRKIETELLRTLLMVQLAFNRDFPNVGDPDLFDVSVTYAEPAVSLSVQDEVLMEHHEITNGLRSKGELVMRRHPDRFDSEEEAEAWAKERTPAPTPAPGSFGANEEQEEKPE